MRLLILTFYFEPDLSAGSFRASALVKALRERAPPGTQIDVFTTLPNRYQGFARAAAASECAPGLEIHRVALPAHQSDMLRQSRAFAHFASAANRFASTRSYDLVYATSGRLMTAVLAAWIARRKKARLYLDIRDIFADTIGDLLTGSAASLARRVFTRLEGWAIRRADRINLVSPGFEAYFRSRYGERSFRGFTNGIDEEFLVAALQTSSRRAVAGPPTILYAGNLGEGQALHRIVPGLAAALNGVARFVIIGDGGRRQVLIDALAAAGVGNVELRAPLDRAALVRAYQEADVLFLHLGPQPAFEKVLPSKMFEYAALGKPVLAGVAGSAAHFLREEVDNSAVFAPCDVPAAVLAWQSLKIEDRPRPQFVAKYRRSTIARAMADDVLALAGA